MTSDISTHNKEHKGYTLEVICKYDYDTIEASVKDEHGVTLYKNLSYISTKEAFEKLEKIAEAFYTMVEKERKEYEEVL